MSGVGNETPILCVLVCVWFHECIRTCVCVCVCRRACACVSVQSINMVEKHLICFAYTLTHLRIDLCGDVVLQIRIFVEAKFHDSLHLAVELWGVYV